MSSHPPIIQVLMYLNLRSTIGVIAVLTIHTAGLAAVHLNHWPIGRDINVTVHKMASSRLEPLETGRCFPLIPSPPAFDGFVTCDSTGHHE